VSTRFTFHIDPIDPPASFTLDPEFPIRRMGGGGATMATWLDGVTPQALPAGTQLRQTDDGFAMKMTLYFRAAAPSDMHADHSRHHAGQPNRAGGQTGMSSRAGKESSPRLP
jgi:hypothetical protein